jgi:hypothetical protein
MGPCGVQGLGRAFDGELSGPKQKAGALIGAEMHSISVTAAFDIARPMQQAGVHRNREGFGSSTPLVERWAEGALGDPPADEP